MPDKPPAFQWYPKDHLSHTRITRLSYEHQGVYVAILCHMWVDDPDACRILKQPQELAKILHVTVKKIHKFLAEAQALGREVFQEDGAYYVCQWLLEQRAKQREHYLKRSQAGKLGAKKRWH